MRSRSGVLFVSSMLVVAIAACSHLPYEPVACHGYEQLDTLRIFITRATGRIDSVHTKPDYAVHVCGEPFRPPAKPKPDTVYTAA